MSIKICSFESNVGGGKSTLINKIMERVKSFEYPECERYILIDEPVDEWKTIMVDGQDILSHFYENMKEVSLPFQLIALLTRYRLFEKKIKEAKELSEKLGKTIIIITERTIHSDKHIFATMLHKDGFINNSGMKAYEMWNDEFSKTTNIDKIVYINTPPEICFERIKIRNRSGEESISLNYLKECQKAHDKFYEDIISKNSNMVIDTSKIINGTPEYEKLVDSVIDYFNL